MAFTQFINGDVPATGAVAMWTLIQMWIAAGASKLADSDGTTYSSSGTRVTSGASGAQGLGNASAWVRIRFLDGREFTIQRGSNNVSWRIKYSAQAQFTGGSPGAVQTPTAADEAIRLGGGTDASPTYVTLFTTDASYKLYGGADNASAKWWFNTALIAGGAANAGMFVDLIPTPTTGDNEACVIGIAVSGNTFTSSILGANNAVASGSGVMGWLKYGLSGAGYVALPAMTINDSAGAVWPNNAGTNPHTGKDVIKLIEYNRKSSLTAPTGPKGTGSIVAWNPTSRSAIELYSIASTRDRIVFGDANFPWNGAVVL